MRWMCVLFVSLLFFACKKEGDTVDPAVEITSPVDGAQYNVGDTIHLVIEIADDVELADLEIKLTDMNLTAVMPTATIAVTGDGGTLHIDYFLDDPTILTGQYYLQATAHDAARNSAKDFVAINVTEIPRVLNGAFAVTTSPGFVSLHCIDQTWVSTGYGTFPGDFTDLAVNPWWQQVTFTGAVNGITRCFSIDGTHPGWTINPFPSAGAYWGNVIAKDRDWLINYRTDGVIKACTWNGTISSSYNANSGYFFHHFAFSENRLFADMVDAAGTSHLIGVYQGGGGAIQQTVLSLDPIEILPRDAATVYVAGNQNNQGKLLIYDYDLNGTWEPIALPAGKLLSACEVDANTLLLAMDNGNVYKFTYAPVGVLVWNAVAAQQVRYDAVENSVFTAEGVNIRQYDYQQTTLLGQIPMSDSVRDLELWYNR